jgi:hypothetical protein
MRAASLTATPSPDNPQAVPSEELARNYARLLNACYQIRKTDTDAQRLEEIERIVTFADGALSSFGDVARTAGPPVPSLPSPTPAQPAAAAPMPPAGPDQPTPPVAAAPGPSLQGVAG